METEYRWVKSYATAELIRYRVENGILIHDPAPAEANIDQMRESIATLTRERDEARERGRELAERIVELDDQCCQLHSKYAMEINSLTNHYAGKSSAVAHRIMIEQRDAWQKRAVAAESHLAHLQAEKDSLEVERTEQAARIAELERELSGIMCHVATAKAALDLAPDNTTKSPWVAVPRRELSRALNRHECGETTETKEPPHGH